MKLRKEQLGAISRAQQEQFAERMVGHLWVEFHDECLRQGFRQEQDVRPFVDRGIAAAKGYGLATEGGARQYLDCMIVLGPGFDKDPAYHWAREILTDPGRDASRKSESLAWHMLSVVKWKDGPHG